MSAKFRIKPDSKRKAVRKMDAIAKRKIQDVAKALAIVAGDIVGETQEELLKVDAKDQGGLIAATVNDPVRREGKYLKSKIHNDLEYASVIEFGRRPKQGLPPPLLPLVGWAARKGIIKNLPRNIGFGGRWAKLWAASGAIFKRLKEGRKGKSKGKTAIDPEIKDMITIRSIANKIYEKGTKGRRPFSKVHDRRVKTITRDVANVLRSMR